MATWTTLPDASLEPGKPIRSIDGLALRDNPIAISEGAAGAPRIVGLAAKRPADYPVVTVSAAATIVAEFGFVRVSLTLENSGTSNVVAGRITIQTYSGSMRFGATHLMVSGGGVVTLELYKNNSLIQGFTTSSSTPVSRSVDSSVSPNDVFEWRHRTQFAGQTSIVSFSNPSASDAYVSFSSRRPLIGLLSTVGNL
jgi:hypothetical protein